MKPTIGCGSGGSEGAGPEGLPGLLISIAFVAIFALIFLPASIGDWFLVWFPAAEIAAAILYILIDRRNRRDSDRLKREFHRINE